MLVTVLIYTIPNKPITFDGDSVNLNIQFNGLSFDHDPEEYEGTAAERAYNALLDSGDIPLNEDGSKPAYVCGGVYVGIPQIAPFK